MRIGNLKIMEKRVIDNDPVLGPLVVRWILLRHPKVFGIFLHKLCRSDHDRSLHDHPWSFLSLLLKNGYSEERFVCDIHDEVVTQYDKHRVGAILWRPATWRHRVIIEPGKPAWTLIFLGPRARRWGFWTKTGWCWWKKYNPVKGICEEEILYPGEDE